LLSLLRGSGNWIVAALAGVATGLAALITIKTAFYLPVIAGVIWCASPSIGDRARLAAAFSVALALSSGTLYLAHGASLKSEPQIAAASYLGGAASKVLFEDGLFPRWADFLIVVSQNPFFWIMAVVGAGLVWRKARSASNREDWLPLVLALPLLTPLIYRNAFAYYFVFALPSAAVLIALFYAEQRRRAAAEPNSPAIAVIALMVAAHGILLGVNAWRNHGDKITPQRTVLAAVHDMFPRPVPYIDGYGVVGTFPRYGFFMSSWGMQIYQKTGRPYYPDLVAQAQPPLLLADSASLYAALIPGVTVKEERRLLPEDVRFLQDNYVQHWGLIFVAGKKLRPPAAGGRAGFETAIAGDYRLEAAAPLTIDGVSVQPGEIVTLGSGEHWFQAERMAPDAVLRWANVTNPPSDEPVHLLTFFGVNR